MAAPANASSTEKLLEVIRGTVNKGEGGETTPPPRPLQPKKKFTLDFSRLFKPAKPGGSKNVRLGVEMTDNAVRMVKLTMSSGRARTVELKTVPVPPEGPDAPELSLVLRLALKDFLGKADADVWAMVPAESADLRFLQVPKTGKKQISNAVYWTAKKEEPFDESEVMFDYELQGEVMEKGAPRLSVLAYTVKREEFEKLKNLFMQAGYPLTGVTTPPVAMRNLLRKGFVQGSGKTLASLHLGEEFSRLEIFSDNALQYVRTVKGGLAAMAQALAEESKTFVPKTPPVSPAVMPGEAETVATGAGETVAVVPETPLFSPGITVEIESMDSGAPPPEPVPTAGLTPEEAREVLLGLGQGTQALPEGHPGRFYGEEDVLAMLGQAWERLLRQVQMTFSHHAVTLGNEQVGSLLLDSPLGACRAVLEHLSERLSMPCALFDPLDPENLGRLGVSSPAPGLPERLPYGLVLGLTDSDRAACNLLYTYKQKEEEARVESLNKTVALCWLGAVAVVAGVYIWQHTRSYVKHQELASLDTKLSAFKPRVNMPFLLDTGAKARTAIENLRAYAGRMLPSAIIKDVTELTPENVKLYQISMDLGTPEEQPLAPGGAKPPAKPAGPAVKNERLALNTITLEGYVKGDNQILESLLSAYLVRLRTSPLLGEPSVSKRSLETTSAGEDILRFVLSCQVRR